MGSFLDIVGKGCDSIIQRTLLLDRLSKITGPLRYMSHIMRKPVYVMCEQHPLSLISAFVVHCLDSIIAILVKSRISRL